MSIRTIAFIDHHDDEESSGDTARLEDLTVLRMRSVAEIDSTHPPDLVIVRHPLEAHEGVIEFVRDDLKHRCLVVFSYCEKPNTVIGVRDGIEIIRQSSECITPGLIMGIEQQYSGG